MATLSIYDKYIPGLTPPIESIEESCVFVINKSELLVKQHNSEYTFPTLTELGLGNSVLQSLEYLGSYDKKHCYCLNYYESLSIPVGMVFENMRSLLATLEPGLALVAGRAMHITNWSRLNKFCGACGTQLYRKVEERAMMCPSCGNVIYPRISPAIIIAVVNKDKILLAHNKNFQGKRHSVIAGFMEPGETFEDCAKREVFEEVGIHVKNIKFFGNQPWPFPDSLMIGLTAEYESGEIRPDGVEIDTAGWFSREELPEVPGTISIAGRLIEWFLKNN